jgi:hypothetical protein
MKNRPLTLEHGLYVLALAVALTLRFLHLGALPLSDYEADWALQALRVAGGLHPAVGSDPAYVHLTAILFFALRASNFLARFWPALAGGLLVLAPWPLRGRLGRVPALVLAFGLAIDPGLAGLSRLAGGPMLAIAFVVFGGLAWLEGRHALAGVLAGMALLSGVSAWFGLAGLALAWVAANALWPKRTIENSGDKKEKALPEAESTRQGLRQALVWGLGTLLVAGSLFALSPQGLSGFLRSLGDFVRGWWILEGVPFWQPLLALPAYELLPLGFGIAGVVRGLLKQDVTSRRLTAWALAALVLALVYPSKQTGDLAWALLPLWALASQEIGRHFDFEGRDAWQLAAVVTVVFSLLTFGWLQLAALTTMDLAGETAHIRWLVVAAIVLLVGLSLLLAGAGWSAAAARLGGVWGGLLALFAFTLAMTTGTTGVREPLTYSLWQPEPRPAARLDLILKVANQISDLNTGYQAQLPLTFLDVDSPALEWLFRDWQVQLADGLAPDATPEMIVSPHNELNLTAKYRGEALALREQANWAAATGGDWLEWLVYRQIPVSSEDVILWVRSDLMLDSQGVPPASP